MSTNKTSLVKSALGEFLGCFIAIIFTTIFIQEVNIDHEANEEALLRNASKTFFIMSSLIWMFYNISGGHFHAGVSLSCALIGQ